ncbi:MAG TPA: sugar phosphate isomerase/epimerase family protein [Syntrophorhabdaceae bacterium]|jgi:sugar phosphate isomerase/epimerase
MKPLFINVPYRRVEENLARILSLGTGIEIYIDNHLVEEAGDREVRELGNRLAGHGIAVTVHAPYMDLSPGGFDRSVRRITKEKLKKAAGLAGLLHAKGLVCHPGYDKWRFGGNEELWLEGSVDTWTEVIAEAKGGPIVMVENIFEEEPSTLIALFDRFREEDLFFCFDSGHFNLFSTVPVDKWLTPIRSLVREMHLHDNHGRSDEHLPVGEGTFPFRELKTFLSAQESMIFTAEVHGESRANESIKKLKEFLS